MNWTLSRLLRQFALKAWNTTSKTTDPITATSKLYRFSPVTPEAPKVLKSQPPARAAEYTEHDIEEHTLTLFIHNLAPNETGEQT